MLAGCNLSLMLFLKLEPFSIFRLTGMSFPNLWVLLSCLLRSFVVCQDIKLVLIRRVSVKEAQVPDINKRSILLAILKKADIHSGALICVYDNPILLSLGHPPWLRRYHSGTAQAVSCLKIHYCPLIFWSARKTHCTRSLKDDTLITVRSHLNFHQLSFAMQEVLLNMGSA